MSIHILFHNCTILKIKCLLVVNRRARLNGAQQTFEHVDADTVLKDVHVVISELFVKWPD